MGVGAHLITTIDVAQRAGFTLEEIRTLTGPENSSPKASRHVRVSVEQRLPQIDALIERAAAVRRWLVAARECDCERVDVCSLFVDRELAPPCDHLVRQRGLRTRDLLRLA